nr:NADH dehydrogenase subunit 5 [Ophiocten ludwigi]
MILSTITIFSLFIFLPWSYFSSSGKLNPSHLLMNAAILAISILNVWFVLGNPNFLINLNWLSLGLQNFSVSIIIDLPFVIFSAVGLFVTWSIIEFTSYYMSSDPNKNLFTNTLILFLLFMLILVASNNLFVLFIGWEGVGIMSFVLISWWFTRSDANSSAIQAIIYNRIGDTGIVIFMFITLISYNTWNINSIIFLNNPNLMNVATVGIILAAAGKSAQFSLHPWLPAAMEGPTPVSALLHSSTMVVAGVFLLFRCSPIISESSWGLTIVSILGSLTALFAASIALVQYDMKKIVAFSTTSQLGLMVLAIGINIPELALFHICTHAFFKALLFLCSGSIIHSLNNEQDIRKISNSSANLPLTSSCIIIGSLALTGLPFLAGYYSKDLILEASQVSLANSISILLGLIATLFTAVYSMRLIYYTVTPIINNNVINPMSEENLNLQNPLIRLTAGVFSSGWIASLCFFNNEGINIPLINKIAPLAMLIVATIYFFNSANNGEIEKGFLVNATNFLSNSWFYTNIFHSNTLSIFVSQSISGILRTLDQGWTSLIGAIGITKIITSISLDLLNAQSSIIVSYFKFLVLVAIASFLVLVII